MEWGPLSLVRITVALLQACPVAWPTAKNLCFVFAVVNITAVRVTMKISTVLPLKTAGCGLSHSGAVVGCM
jgi:hypothetical protein